MCAVRYNGVWIAIITKLTSLSFYKSHSKSDVHSNEEIHMPLSEIP